MSPATATRESIKDRLHRHRDSRAHYTDTHPLNCEEVRHLHRERYGIYADSNDRRLRGLVAVLDMSVQQWTDCNTTRSPVLPRPSGERVYHLPRPEFVPPSNRKFARDIPAERRGPRLRQHFNGTGPVPSQQGTNRFIASSWGTPSEEPDISSSYFIQPDFAPAVSEEREPTEVHDRQIGLADYSNVQPCGYDEVRECACCVCPECGSVAVRERKDEPAAKKYACGNPSCNKEPFPEVDVKPARRD